MSHEASAGAGAESGWLARLGDELAAAVGAAAPSVVRVDDGSSLTATGLVWEADGVIVTTSHGTERDDDLAVVTADGVVQSAGSRRALGQSVIIRHGYGVETKYGHLQEVLVQAGDRVKRGQKIGLMGSTGRSTDRRSSAIVTATATTTPSNK